jgi:hypothetical protein
LTCNEIRHLFIHLTSRAGQGVEHPRRHDHDLRLPY